MYVGLFWDRLMYLIIWNGYLLVFGVFLMVYDYDVLFKLGVVV